MAVKTLGNQCKAPWNRGGLVGQKPPLKLSEIWAIRTRLQLAGQTRDLALFNLAIDSKLRACGLTKLRVRDVTQGGSILRRVIVMQQKTGRPVQFETAEHARVALSAWLNTRTLRVEDYLFHNRFNSGNPISTRQYARIVNSWVQSIGLNPASYGTHSLRSTKATLIYKRTKNIRAVQLLLGHTKLESTVRYLGIEVDDALELSEQTEV